MTSFSTRVPRPRASPGPGDQRVGAAAAVHGTGNLGAGTMLCQPSLLWSLRPLPRPFDLRPFSRPFTPSRENCSALPGTFLHRGTPVPVLNGDPTGGPGPAERGGTGTYTHPKATTATTPAPCQARRRGLSYQLPHSIAPSCHSRFVGWESASPLAREPTRR